MIDFLKSRVLGLWSGILKAELIPFLVDSWSLTDLPGYWVWGKKKNYL